MALGSGAGAPLARPLLPVGAYPGGSLNVSTTQPDIRVVAAPENLGLASRDAFRQQANSLLDEMGTGRGQLVVDMRGTKEIDSSGLSALVMVHRHAVERRQQVVLRNVCPEIEFLLVLTKLDDLFLFSSDS